jgi:hypothetical protein
MENSQAPHSIPASPALNLAPSPLHNLSPQKFSLLGSTGSIGTQTLDIVAENPEKFEVVALAAGSNVELLAEQVKQFQPSLVCLRDANKVQELKELIRGARQQPEIVVGDQGICDVAAHPDADACVTGIVGCAGLRPTVAAIKAGKDICLANKETLIAGGPFVLPLAKEYGVHILPADSEHSAIFQCLQVGSYPVPTLASWHSKDSHISLPPLYSLHSHDFLILSTHRACLRTDSAASSSLPLAAPSGTGLWRSFHPSLLRMH